MNKSQGGPASSAIWKLGTHQVEISTATSAIRPNKELHGPGGAKRKIFLFARAEARRNARWVIRIMIQAKGPPKKPTPIMNTNALFLKSCERIRATAIPALDASTAATGIPRL